MCLQIISNAYRKQPYIRVPTAWITPLDRTGIIQECQKSLGNLWNVKEMQLNEKDMQKEKWFWSLKCHPASAILIEKKMPKEYKKELPFYMILIYPKSYRSVIEDPLVEKPLTIKYLGQMKHLAFYYYTKVEKNDKSSPLEKITISLKMKK